MLNEIREITKEEQGFYPLLGPVFGSRSISRVVGIQLYDDDDKRWFIGLEEGLIGCASLRGGLVSDCYVYPDHRLQGVFGSILDRLIQKSIGPLRATCTGDSRWAFKSRGFVEEKQTKTYTWMKLNRA